MWKELSTETLVKQDCELETGIREERVGERLLKLDRNNKDQEARHFTHITTGTCLVVETWEEMKMLAPEES